MNDILNSVDKVLRNNQDMETQSFYKDYKDFSKIYDSLLQEGMTHKRESHLQTIIDRKNTNAFVYNCHTFGRPKLT
jgi:hypothetical protein